MWLQQGSLRLGVAVYVGRIVSVCGGGAGGIVKVEIYNYKPLHPYP